MKAYRSANTLTLTLALLSAQALAGAPGDSFEGAAKDAWLAGKVEMAFTLNQHLNPFEINTDVQEGVVNLTGTVDSGIDRDLAGEIARGIEGVVSVDNDIRVEAVSDQRAERSGAKQRNFPSWFDDATTTAAVKSKLIANANTKGLQIDVDTRDDVVTLSGRVGSEEQRALAEQLARNTSDVEDVRNQLVVDPTI
jgi:hyperosmotically inducible protein